MSGQEMSQSKLFTINKQNIDIEQCHTPTEQYWNTQNIFYMLFLTVTSDPMLHK
jgi:hypothetical protein